MDFMGAYKKYSDKQRQGLEKSKCPVEVMEILDSLLLSVILEEKSKDTVNLLLPSIITIKEAFEVDKWISSNTYPEEFYGPLAQKLSDELGIQFINTPDGGWDWKTLFAD